MPLKNTKKEVIMSGVGMQSKSGNVNDIKKSEAVEEIKPNKVSKQFDDENVDRYKTRHICTVQECLEICNSINNYENSIIQVINCKEHNLKNISVAIPKNKLVVFCGVSGSGKTSLAINTIHAEGQRKYVESLSSYSRQFLGILPKPDVESIKGLSPSIAITQKNTSNNPRSTVATATEVYDYLRVLFARVGALYIDNKEVKIFTDSEIVDKILLIGQCQLKQSEDDSYENDIIDKELNNKNDKELNKQYVKEASNQDVKEVHSKFVYTKVAIISKIDLTSYNKNKKKLENLFKNFQSFGFRRFIIDEQIVQDDEGFGDIKFNKIQSLSIIIDRFNILNIDYSRLNDSVKLALQHSHNIALFDLEEKKIIEEFSTSYTNLETQFTIDKLEPSNFSFNNPRWACTFCNGTGEQTLVDENKVIPDPSLSILEGAIHPHFRYARSKYYELFHSICTHFKQSIRQPFSTLSLECKHALFYGIKENKIDFCGIAYEIEKLESNSKKDFITKIIAGYKKNQTCTHCDGARLRDEILCIKILGKSIYDITKMNIVQAREWLIYARDNLYGKKKIIAEKIINEIEYRLNFLINVGLDYISLSRTTSSMSGGEMQRITLASQLGAGLSGVIFVLDEPSIGLHPKDTYKLIKVLLDLKHAGNTLLVIEHEKMIIESADFIVEVGPKAGIYGGEIVFADSIAKFRKANTSTSNHIYPNNNNDNTQVACSQGFQNKTEQLVENTAEQDLEKTVQQEYKIINKTAKNTIVIKKEQKLIGKDLSISVINDAINKIINKQKIDYNNKSHIILTKANAFNLNNIDITFPLEKFICITGVSGSGKSSLIMETLLPALKDGILKQSTPGFEVKKTLYKEIYGIENIKKIVTIDQTPIGRTPRSNPATYIDAFTPIRELFSNLPESKARGYLPGNFSFNVKGGRCEACQGDGYINVEMHFLSDILVECDFCKGKRYNKDTLEIYYKGKNIHDVLNMTVQEACAFFENIPSIYSKLSLMKDVGLEYLKLGQSATTLSGGEAQRIKLTKELNKKGEKCIYILDEPTTGLHFDDIIKLLNVLKRLINNGNTILVIEHNTDMINASDWVIDLGNFGGDKGGNLSFCGELNDLKSLQKLKLAYENIDKNNGTNNVNDDKTNNKNGLESNPYVDFINNISIVDFVNN